MVQVTGKTKLLGIIGDPVEHSLSPVMHNAAIANLGLDFIYVPFPVQQGSLAEALTGFKVTNVRGFSITIPHKQEIIPLLAEISDDAANIGAVNTVWRTKSGWKGTNTDAAGFIAPLKTMNRDWKKNNSVILGNGGAARAVIAGLTNLGCPKIHVAGRNPDKLARFYESWSHAPKITDRLKIHNWDNLSSLIPMADLLVNTTPVGMSPHVDASPVEESLMQKLKENAIAYDADLYSQSDSVSQACSRSRGNDFGWIRDAGTTGGCCIGNLAATVRTCRCNARFVTRIFKSVICLSW